MTRSLKSGIFALALLPLASTQAHAISGFGSGGSNFSIVLEHDRIQRKDMANYSADFVSGDVLSLNGNLTAQKGLAKLSYVSGGMKFSVIGGIAFDSSFSVANQNTSSSPTEHTQSWQFDSAATYGAALEWDLIPESPFHFRPKMQFVRTGYKGTKGSVNSSACSYDFSSGAAASAGCETLSGMSLSTGYAHTLQSDFQENNFSGGIELALDLRGDSRGSTPDFTIFAGGEAGLTSLSGSSVVTRAIDSRVLGTENLNYEVAKKQGVYAGLQFGLSEGLLVGAKYHALDHQTVSSTLEYRF